MDSPAAGKGSTGSTDVRRIVGSRMAADTKRPGGCCAAVPGPTYYITSYDVYPTRPTAEQLVIL